ncbi:MAG: sensor histidine kinase [Anaerotardibacter sp.]
MVNQQNNYSEEKTRGLSFTSRVAMAFVVVAVATIAALGCVLACIWEVFFQDYTRENMERLADSIAENCEKSWNDWYGGALASASAASALYDSVFITVVDADGHVIYSERPSGIDTNYPMQKQMDKNTAMAPIMCDGEKVGAVYVSVFGSDSLLTEPDIQFKNNTYLALFIAAFVGIVFAMIAGVIFARGMMRPVQQITVAANKLKEGDMTARTGVQVKGDIGRLASTFDAMAEELEANQKLERQLVTDVAHELRTPLMAIQSTVEAMIDGVYKPDQEHLSTLHSEVSRLSRLVDALLKLSRLENRATPVEFERLDLVELMDAIATTHAVLVNESGLEFEYIHDPHVYVYGNKDMIRQATANLISNAVRYTPEGGKVTLIIHKGDIMGQIIVKDTGIGLTAEEAKKVFQRFWRADSGRARETGGLGIGLSVVKEIVDRHNGWVRVEGRPNEGATFTINIPLYTEQSARVTRKRLSGRS